MLTFLVATFGTFIIMFFVEAIVLGLIKLVGGYTIVKEGYCHVYVLFGTVLAVLDEPGLYLLWRNLGWRALIVNWMGTCHVVDMRRDQYYLRSQPVNSEEGAPMGIGVWYEMYVSDPVAFLFRNTDPQGSLAANVTNAIVRCLSNMPLAEMLETRHPMSQAVREDVSPKSHEWGYKLGSVYIRKVHFRDKAMVKQIESKVVNRLRQVTSAITQDGENQVNYIKSSAERTAAVEFAKAEAIRASILGEALHEISRDPEVAQALFEILENQYIGEGNASITMIPANQEMLTQLLTAPPERANNLRMAGTSEVVR